jgi:WD40 repeat protein
MEKQNWVSRRTSVLEELSCLLWGAALFGGTLTGYLKSEPLGKLADSDLCLFFTVLRDGTYLFEHYELKQALLKALIDSIHLAIYDPKINNYSSRQQKQTIGWLKKRTSAIQEEIRFCSLEQSWAKTDTIPCLVTASPEQISQYSPRDRSQALQNLKQKIESALYINTIPPEFRQNFKQTWLPFVSLFLAQSLTTYADLRKDLIKIIEQFNPSQSSGNLEPQLFPQARESVAQLIKLFVYPQICLSIVQIIDFDYKLLKQQIRNSQNQSLADTFVSEDINHTSSERSPQEPPLTRWRSKRGETPVIVDPVESGELDEINSQTVRQTNQSSRSHSPSPGTRSDRSLDTPQTNPITSLPPSKPAFKPPQILNSGADTKRSAFNWKCIHTLTGHSDSVVSVAYGTRTRETYTLASGSWDKTIQIWAIHPSLAQPLLIRTLTAHSASVYSVALSPDGQTLASGGVDCAIQLWHLGTTEQTNTGASLMRKLTGHTFPVYSIAFSPDGKLLASGSGDYTIKIWNLETGQLLSTLAGHSSFVYSVAFSPDGKTLASGSADKSIKIWQVSNSQLLTTLISYASVNSVAFSPDPQFLVSAGSDERIKLWQFTSSRLDSDTRLAPSQILKGHSGEIFSLAFNPRQPILASSSYDKTIKLWHLRTGNLLGTLTGHLHSVHSLAFSSDGMMLVSGSHDKTIKVWKLIANRQILNP